MNAQSVRDLQDALEAKYKGLVLMLSYLTGGDEYSPPIVRINTISIPKDERKQGLGSEIMSQIISWADTHGVMLTLSPSTDFGATSVARLTRFYRRFGFVPNKGRNKDFRTRDTMLRNPKRVRTSAKRDDPKLKNTGHGGLDTWFAGHGGGKPDDRATWGDWIAVTPIKHTIKKDDGEEKVYEAGDIVGPCAISSDPQWASVTNNGKNPLKCMPRDKAHDLTKDQRATLARKKRREEAKSRKGQKPVLTPTFSEKGKEMVNKKAYFRSAGMLKPPPKMVEPILNWAMSNIAHYRLDDEIEKYERGLEATKDYDLLLEIEKENKRGNSEKVQSLIGRITNPLLMYSKKPDPSKSSEVVSWLSFNLSLIKHAVEETSKKELEIEALKQTKSSSFENEKWFKIDLEGWYFNNQALREIAERERDRWLSSYEETRKRSHLEIARDYEGYLKGKQSQFGHILVKLSKRASTASWSPNLRTLTIPLHISFDKLREAILHELTHMGQTVGNEVKNIKSFGLPSEKMRDTEVKQTRTNLNVSKEEYLKQVEQHHLDDVEFYTDLKDEINKLKDYLARNQGSLTSLFRTFINRSVFFDTLKKKNSAKWKKAVNEAFREVNLS